MEEEYCWNCGAELDPEARFCSDCGYEVDESATAASPDYDDSISRLGRERRTDGDTTFAALTHILALVAWAIGPLIVLVVTEDEFVEENARNALNWQIMFTIYMVVSFVLLLVLVGFVLILVVPAVSVVFCIVAAVKASEGEAWKYPLTPEIV